MDSKQKKIVIGIIVIVLAAVGGIYFNKWLGVKMQKVELGLAEPNFPYRNYTQEELNKMYPQIKYADVPTRITPEETYAKFRQALKDNNLEMALEQLSKDSGRYEENVKILTDAHEQGKFSGAYQEYPEEIWRGTFGESIGQICYTQKNGPEEFVGCSSFIKDANGDWKIDSL